MAFWAAAAPIIGGVAASALSALSGKDATKTQIKWERERAQNAHQWEVEDLKKAGLNPILSAGGSGAVTGGISAPVADTSAIAGIMDQVTAYKAQKAQQKLQEQNVKQSEQQTKNLEIQNEILKAQANAEKSNSATTVVENERKQKYLKHPVGKALHYIGYGLHDVGGALVGGAVGMSARGIGKAFRNKDKQPAMWYNPKTGKAEWLD